MALTRGSAQTELSVSKVTGKRSKASAKLEGRVIPAGYKRSAAVKAYITKQQPPKR